MRIPRHHSKQCGYRDTIPTLVPACSPLSTTQAGREKALDVGALEVETTCRGEMPGERHAPPLLRQFRITTLSPPWRRCRKREIVASFVARGVAATRLHATHGK